MDFSWMGVGSNIFIRAIAALVMALRAIPGNTAAPASVSLSVNGATADSFTGEEKPIRRALKHAGQYTGLSLLGRKGTVVEVPHSAQTA
jgi:hypothetical protein